METPNIVIVDKTYNMSTGQQRIDLPVQIIERQQLWLFDSTTTLTNCRKVNVQMYEGLGKRIQEKMSDLMVKVGTISVGCMESWSLKMIGS